MITETVLDLCSRVIAWLVGLMPSWTPPEWADSLGQTWADTLANAGGFSYWLPFSAFAAAILGLSIAFALAVTIRIARIVASFATLGGGGAG